MMMMVVIIIRTGIMMAIKMIRVTVEIMAMMDVSGELAKSEYQQSGTISIDFFSTLCFKYVYSNDSSICIQSQWPPVTLPPELFVAVRLTSMCRSDAAGRHWHD